MTLRLERFQVDLQTGELRKDDRRVKQKPQAARVLALLANRHGAVVTREEIKQELWGDDTFVDFDLGINSCIRQIRMALGDDSEESRFVRTLPNKGYRLVIPREVEGAPQTGGDDNAADGVGGSARPTRSWWRRSLPWGILGGAAAAVLVAAVLGVRPTSREVRVVRAEISAPEGTTFHLEAANPGPPALSPDGRMLVFSARDDEENLLLYVRDLDATEARALPGTELAQYPFWSPDSRWIGFFADGQLKTIEATGGTPDTLCDAATGKGGSWNHEGVILFAPEHLGGLYRVAASGGTSTAVTEPDAARGDNSHRHPRFLPDGRHFLYLARNQAGVGSNVVMVGSLDGTLSVEVVHSPVAADFASEHLLFVRGRGLMAQRFDVARLSLVGEPTLIADEVRVFSSAALGFLSASQVGELVYLKGETSTGTDTDLRWVDRTGESQGILDRVGHSSVFPSPDGRHVAVPIFDSTGTSDLWLYDIARGNRTRFTFDPGSVEHAVWSPDGGAIIFSSRSEDRFAFYRKKVGGSDEQELLLDSDVAKTPTSWSPDGLLAFHTDGDIWVHPLEGDAAPYAFVQSDAFESWGAFSPDGRWMAYSSDESGQAEVYVTPFPGPGRKWLVSTDGGRFAWWRRDGREIVYQEPNGLVVAVEVEAREDTFIVGTHTPLFEAIPPHGGAGVFHYGPMPDAQRFLLLQAAEEDSRPLTLVVNWTKQLER